MNMKTLTKDDFQYIKFENLEELQSFILTMQLILYADKDKNLYCYNYDQYRAVRFDREQKKWVMDDKKSISDYKGFQQITGDLAKDIYKAIPPFECFREIELQHEKDILQSYEELRRKTQRKVVGWVEELEGYEEADDREEMYTAALLNDIVEHDYFFVAGWMPLTPVFDDGKYLMLSDRAMGYVMAVSKGKARDYDYVDYTFGEPWFFEEDSFFHKPEKGLYSKK